jgi:DNA-binding transcriptional regulator YiaG
VRSQGPNPKRPKLAHLVGTQRSPLPECCILPGLRRYVNNPKEGYGIVRFGLFHTGLYHAGCFWAEPGMEKSVFTHEYRVFLRLFRETREAANLTQVQFAKKLGQSQSFVSKCERGERRLDVVQLRTICKVLGTSLTEFAEEFERRLATKGGKGQ